MCVLKKPTCDSVVNPLSLEGAQILSPIANGHSLLVVLETAQVEASDRGEMHRALDPCCVCGWSGEGRAH